MKKKISLKFRTNLQVTKEPKRENQDSSLQLLISYKDNLITHSEEVLFHNLGGLVSQLGSVLSLFLGFSFFSVICQFLEFIKKKI